MKPSNLELIKNVQLNNCGRSFTVLWHRLKNLIQYQKTLGIFDYNSYYEDSDYDSVKKMALLDLFRNFDFEKYDDSKIPALAYRTMWQRLQDLKLRKNLNVYETIGEDLYKMDIPCCLDNNWIHENCEIAEALEYLKSEGTPLQQRILILKLEGYTNSEISIFLGFTAEYIRYNLKILRQLYRRFNNRVFKYAV